MSITNAPGQFRVRQPGDLGSALDERQDAPARADWRPMGSGGLPGTGASGGVPGGGSPGDEPAEFVQSYPVQALRYSAVSDGLTGDLDGVNDEFELAHEPAGGIVLLFVNGGWRLPGAGNDYTLSGKTLTLAVAPASDEVLAAIYWRSS